MSENIFLSVIVPYHKSCGNIRSKIESLMFFLASKPFISEIFVMSGSDEMFLDISKNAADKVFLKIHKRSDGLGYTQNEAYLEGFRNARGEWALLLDSDMLTLFPALDMLISEIDATVDIIRSYRINFIRENPLRKAGSRVMNIIFNVGAKTRLKDVGSSFSAYRKKIYKKVSDPRFNRYHSFLPFVVSMLAEKGKMKEIPVEIPQKAANPSSYKITGLICLSFKIFYLKIWSLISRKARKFSL